jgi:NitT/TauT family transport system permease protein
MSDVAARAEIYRQPLTAETFGVIETKLSLFERAYDRAWLRKLVLLGVLAAIWEVYGRWLDNDLLVPPLSATVQALAAGLVDGTIVARTLVSLRVLGLGLGIGVLLAAVLTAFAVRTRIGTDLLESLTAMLNPLPAIALLPLALIWFGLGTGSIVFVLVHSVVWAVSLNAYAGFRSISPTLRMVGHNYELGKFQYFCEILVPAALPNILAGLQIGWAFAWRTLIAAELVFGVSSGAGGLGWFIFESKNQLDIAAVFAGLLTIILIGLFVENVFFRVLAARTVRRWGMQS